ncbi:MAG: hypothetical protein WBL61_12755 [Bryobacteraceae bacterium]
MSAVVNAMTDMRIAPDTARATVSLRGTADQVGLAEWLLHQLDQPAPSSHQPAVYEYRAGTPDSAVRVFRLATVETPQGLNEVTAAIRAIADLSRVRPYAAQRALVARGTPGQVALAEWLLDQLDQPASPVHESAAYDYQEAKLDPAVRVIRLAHIETRQDLQEIANAMRMIADVRKIPADVVQGALVMRGTADQMALAEWLVDELDQPAGGKSSAALSQDPAADEFQVPGSDQIVHVFHFADSTTAQQFVEIAAQARLALKIETIHIYFSQRALLLRGTLDQIAATQQLIQETAKP